MHILIVEDSADILANLVDFLESRGHRADVAMTGRQALYLLESQDYHAVVLDLGLPDMDGLEVCRRLRLGHRSADVPVLMLTARDATPQRLEGFRAGTDDYLVKPFSMEEILARLEALDRRARPRRERRLQVADLVLDPDTHTVTRAGRPIELSPSAWRLLEHLMRESHRVVRRAELERVLWGDDLPPDSDALRTHVYQLRQAIDRPFDRPLLHTVPRIGFRLKDPDES